MDYRERLRQTGRTTRLIQSAPLNAIFVVLKEPSVWRPMVKNLGRADLQVASVSQIASGRFRGETRYLQFVEDHLVEEFAAEHLGRDVMDIYCIALKEFRQTKRAAS